MIEAPKFDKEMANTAIKHTKIINRNYDGIKNWVIEIKNLAALGSVGGMDFNENLNRYRYIKSY